MATDGRSLKIACRLVCNDQWLVTHVDPTWTIVQLKQYLLAKFHAAPDTDIDSRAIPVSPRKARRRSLSPITFALPPQRANKPPVTSTPSSGDESAYTDFSGDVDLDDDDNITKLFTDAHRYKYSATRPSTSSASDSVSRLLSLPEAAQEPQAYILISFSTTQILEDRFSLSWYGTRPNELLELHPASLSFANLSRFSLDAYIEPYFAARVWALRIVGHSKIDRARTFAKHKEEADGGEGKRPKGKRKVTVEWKERWAVIHQGIFTLCKDRHDTHSAFTAPLSSLQTIRDNTLFSLPIHARRRRQKSGTSTPSNVISLKFRSAAFNHRKMSDDASTVLFERRPSDHEPGSPSPPGTAHGGWWRRGSRDVSAALSIGLTSSASALIGGGNGAGFADVWDSLARRGSRAGTEESEDEPKTVKEKGKEREREDEGAVWIILDMLDSLACSNILRIFHRHAPSTCQSSFLPSPDVPIYSPAPSPIIFSSRSSTPAFTGTPPPGPAAEYSFPPTSTHSYSLDSSPSRSSSAHQPPASDARPATPTLELHESSPAGCGVLYPSWRLSIVRTARRAGLGAVGRAMELVMFGDEDDDADDEGDDEDDELAIEWARRNSSLDPSPIERPPNLSQTFFPVLTTPRPSHAAPVFSTPASPGSADTPRGPDTDQPLETPLMRRRLSHPLVDLESERAPSASESESDKSEVEWDGWLDAVIAARQEEAEAAAVRARAQRAALVRSETLETAIGAEPLWSTGWATQFGGSMPVDMKRLSAYSDHDRSQTHPGAWASHKDSDGETSSAHSSDVSSAVPSRRTASGPAGTAAGARHGHTKSANHGRTLSSYSSVDSLLRRTMRTNMQGIGNTARQASILALFPSASEVSLPSTSNTASHPLPPESAHAHSMPTDRSSPSPQPQLARRSIGSIHSTNSASRLRPMSPLATQLQDTHGDDFYGDSVDLDGDEGADVDDVEEDEFGTGGVTESELGHVPGMGVSVHPVPLPGMRMVPAGYTTFQHSSLYGRGSASSANSGAGGRRGSNSHRVGESNDIHAGMAHGQTMQRLPIGMSGVMTTVSSTVSVGPAARRRGHGR